VAIISREYSETTARSYLSSMSDTIPPMPQKIDWFIVLDDGIIRVGYQPFYHELFSYIWQALVVLRDARKCDQRVYKRAGEKEINIDIVIMAKQIDNVGGMGKTGRGIRFVTTHLLDDALKVLCEDHSIRDVQQSLDRRRLHTV
jgi:hypothetical protein